MFKILFTFLGKWFDAVVRFMQVSGGFLSYLISSGFGIVLAFMLSLTSFFHWINRIILYIINYLDTLIIPTDVTSGLTNTATILSTLEIANTFYPVVETFIIMIALAGLAVACGLYGLIKSWIPTVSG